MFRPIAIAALLGLASPAFAQMSHHNMGKDHTPHDMAGHETMAEPDAAAMMGNMRPELTLADRPELAEALAAGGEPIVAKVLGAVCDFCALAMNKTFGKRDEVAAVYVDLDEKTLNLVLKPGATLDDATLIKTVKKSGYKVDDMARGKALVRP